jgi:hypothetical protein
LAQMFPLYSKVLRLFFRWNPEEASRPFYRSRLVAILFIVWLTNCIWAIINFAVYSKGDAGQRKGADYIIFNGFMFVLAPLLALGISLILKIVFTGLQPIVASYKTFPQLHKSHKRMIGTVLAFPFIGMVAVAVGIAINAIKEDRLGNFPLSIFLNFILTSCMLVFIVGALGPLTWSLYLFSTLVDQQAIHVFQSLVAKRDLALNNELDPTKPRLILAVPPLLVEEKTKQESNSKDDTTVVVATGKDSVALSKGSTSDPNALSVDSVLRVQRALQKLVATHSTAWQIPVFLAILVAAFFFAIVVVNLVAGNTMQGSLYIWLVGGPVILLLFLAPSVELNTRWSSILRSPDFDWSQWETSERSWLANRFALSPVTFPVLGLTFDWPSLIKLVASSVTPLIVAQALRFKDDFQNAVVASNKSL